MKKLLYMAVAAIAALSSCTSEDIINGNVNGNGNGNANAPVFTATIEGEAQTRTTIGTGSDDSHKKVLWSNGDEISINGVTYSTTSTTETATFTTSATAPEAVSGKYYAVYPSSITFNTSTKTLTLPATQTYDATTNGIGNVPMVAVSENTELQFKNICTVLAITVPSSEMSSVQKITVSSDKQLNGSVSLKNNNNFELSLISNPSSDEKTLTLDCTNSGSNTTIPAEGKTFYVSIPPQTYGYLQFDVTDGNGTTKTMKTKNGASISVERNKIYPIAFEENQTPKLKIKVTSDDITTLKAIKVVTDQIISGTTSKELVYDVPSAQQTPAADGTVYSINIPAQTYEYYKIYLSADGTTYKEAMASKGTVGEISGPLNIDYEKNAVQLWADGPYFATMNVGETTVGGNTVKYAWGATSADGAPNAKTNNDADTYDDDHDTAYKIWGSAWRMPTKADFEAMSSKCTLDYNSGFIFKGKNGYSSAKVSFPKDSNQIIAQYWTSSVDGNGNVYYGSFQLSPGNTSFYIGASKPKDTNNNDLKYFVRAVLR